MDKFKMRGLFTWKGRSFRLSMKRWRERQGRGAAVRYFLRKPGEDNRTGLGKTVDIAGGLLLIWLTSFVFLANITGKPAAALALSLPILAASAYLLKKISEHRDKRRTYRRNLWQAGQRFMEDILKMNPQKDFLPYVRDILAGLPGFQSVALKTAGKTGKQGDYQGIDLEAVYKGTPLAIHCRRQEGMGRAFPEDIRAFAGAMQLGGFKNGLFVTTGEFEPGVLPVIREFARRGINIKPVDRYRLMALARQSGSAAFRGDETLSGVPFTGTGNRFRAVIENLVTALLESAFSSRKKAKNYFLYGLLLYGGYILLKGSGALSLVYLFFSVLNFLMAAGSIYFGKSLEEIDPLEGLGSEK